MPSFLPAAIVWDVSPEMISIQFRGASLPLAWYGLLFASGFVIGQQIMRYIFLQEKKPAAHVDTLTVYVVIAAVVGARLGHFAFYEWELLLSDTTRWFTTLVTPPFRGLASHGGMIGVLLALSLYTGQKPDQSFFWLTDRLVIPASLAGALIRLGNLCNSEIYGKPTDLPWGFLFVRETDPDLLPVVPRHPTQLYEAFFCLFLLGLSFALWKYRRRQISEGFTTGLFLLLLFSFRFLVEFLKNNQAGFEENLGLNMGQLLSIPAMLSGAVILVISRCKPGVRLSPRSA